ncbi:HvfC/BufC family peptide modification chaperone [Planktotalea sp.]|uniref:HvfC/BufC family peptide modification chaperone n=1 Tax=Planktotalea sp. TaxID=2029877 RepID=UPI003D6AB9CE
MSDSSSLQGMQEWMQNALVHPHKVQTQEVNARLVPSNRLSASERLAIYQRSYITRLCVCLAEQFPASRHALGPALFDNFARVYLARDPSDSYTLYELGRRFPAFLEETRPDAAQPEENRETWINFMIDLATYERSLFVLFDAPGHEGKEWPNVDTPDEDLVLQPCFALGSYRFPVANYYHNVSDNSEVQLPPLENSYVAISRFDYLTSSFPITYPHYVFLKALQNSQNVAAALDHVALALGTSPKVVHASWKDQIREQWLANHFFVSRHALDAK